MLTFETSGSPFERGRQQGEACNALARRWMDTQLQGVADRLKSNSVAAAVQSVQADVERWRQQAAAVYPEGDEESRGIAAGMGLDEATYFAALYSMRTLRIWTRQCTSLAFREANGRPLLCKTDDLLTSEIGGNVLEITRPASGYRHVHIHYAGSIWTVAGMNERGLGMGMTGIPGPVLEQDGLLSLSALHTILPACATVDEALALLRDLRLNYYGFSLLLGDAEGNIALIEKNGVGMTVLPEQPGGFLLHTNHILDAHLAAASPPQVEPVRANGEARYRNALRLLPTLPRTEEGMRRFLGDRSAEGAICQQGEDGLQTDFGVLFLPTEKRFFTWPGGPATVAPEMLDMGSLFRDTSVAG